ncbi:PIN2/TERF1-interacting telomerase inhibitor 1-like [Myxocyprinus asiaticus]|uniref:PIN2/TERF1-interacting telomerase inhibitor 1-like n=1 Tax=Myxocyprinus asiaticus TaxID=70543 RepID=UPI002221EBE8|nr:PIN2/TERF1-interacting telomerase inhibitor 1-like [Myxocyprinus asiaticus]
MSMLAEPRRKQKWSVDPRNSAWSNDESKFGQKMLERMGWSKGKGLGKSEQGSTEHIKVKVKNNSLGLGTSVNNEDNWIAHQDDFNQLLAELNNCHGQNQTNEPTQDHAQSFSLEEKSKTSKKRVHYMKFTKGKDLSSRSETDLACIFGKRLKRETRDQDEESSGPDSQEEREGDNDTENNPNPEEQLNTVTSTLTMQEYFSQRMAQLKKAQVGSDSAASSPGVSSKASAASLEGSPNTRDIEQSKKKRNKKMNRDGTDEMVDVVALTSVMKNSFEEPSRSEKKKKKNKRKREERGEDGVEVCSAPTVSEEALSSERRKKIKTSPEIHAETVEEHKTVEIENVDLEVSDKKKKKNKKREQEEERVTEEIMPKKDKKKKRKKDE